MSCGLLILKSSLFISEVKAFESVPKFVGVCDGRILYPQDSAGKKHKDKQSD